MEIKKKFFKKRKGFTLIEMMISIFIFAIIMTSVASIFAKQVSVYKKARIIESDLENAQFALNYVSKTLRTSSVIGYADKGGAASVDLVSDVFRQDANDDNDFYLVKMPVNRGLLVYDFSQEACVIFTFRADASEDYTLPSLWVETQQKPLDSIGGDIKKCLDSVEWSTGNPTEYKNQRLTSGNVVGSFQVSPTRYMDEVGSRNTDTIGRAVISIKIEPEQNADNDRIEPVYVQSSVALRDYPSDLSF